MGLVFIDLKKAFDTVDHNIHCKKLQLYSIQHRELSWFQSYLSNCKQFCRVNGVDSNIEEIGVGVPQGPCLGPLFLTYINDLPQAVQASTVSMYADDTSLCHQSSDFTQLEEALNSDLKQLKQKHNILKSKNEVLVLNIHNNKLIVIQKTKYFGVQINSSLDWREQIKVVSTKVSRAVGFLRNAKSFLPKESW